MTIETLDGIKIFVLPDNALCCASYKNPCELDECPIGNDVCCPDGCMNYIEGEMLTDEP